MQKLQYTYEMPEGRVYVHIRPADRKSYRDMERGQVTQDVPCVLVSTFRVISEDGRRYLPDEPKGYLKVGANCYRVEDNYRPTTPEEAARWTKPDGPAPWTTAGLSTPYNGGILRESGSRVDYDAPVLKKIRPVIMAALEQFAKEVPNWAEISVCEHLRGEARAAETRMQDARQKAQEAAVAASAAVGALCDYMNEHGLEGEA